MRDKEANLENRRINIRFKINQLRKDKIIYATESCAASLIALLTIQVINQHLPLPSGVKYVSTIFMLTLAVGYAIYVFVGNFIRLRNIRKLEKEL